jgi:hypothetical protein
MSSTNRGSDYIENAAYYTPQRLADALVGLLPIRPTDTALEPHVGGGAFAVCLQERIGHESLTGGDVDERAVGLNYIDEDSRIIGDFLTLELARNARPSWIVGNPPFARDSGRISPHTGKPIMEPCAELHARHALDITGRHVAFLMRLAMLETPGRAAWLASTPLRKVWVLAQRPSFTGSGTDSCAYGFFWWDKEYSGEPELGWVSWN